MSEGDLVADLVVQRLRAWGVHRLFGYPGDGINGLMGHCVEPTVTHSSSRRGTRRTPP